MPEGEQFERQFEIVTLNIGFMVGPNLTGAEYPSGKLIKTIMMGDHTGLIKGRIPMVDVRDVAIANLRAAFTEKAGNQGFSLVSKSIGLESVALELKANYDNHYDIPVNVVSNSIFKLASHFAGDDK